MSSYCSLNTLNMEKFGKFQTCFCYGVRWKILRFQTHFICIFLKKNLAIIKSENDCHFEIQHFWCRKIIDLMIFGMISKCSSLGMTVRTAWHMTSRSRMNRKQPQNMTVDFKSCELTHSICSSVNSWLKSWRHGNEFTFRAFWKV